MFDARLKCCIGALLCLMSACGTVCAESSAIRLNTLGFLTEMPKKATVTSQADAFSVRRLEDDAGGSNGYRTWSFKEQLQEKIADIFGLEVTVCHFPSGASKWNPVEHRLFGPISCHWAGIPLRSLGLLLRLARTTITNSGLKVGARLTRKIYQTGIQVAIPPLFYLNIRRHTVCPRWNYTIEPRQKE